MHRLFGIRYPFGSYHQAFVPEFNAGAMENPGCVTFRDPLIFTTKVTRGARIVRATTVAHEMAHQWFGNLTTPTWWDDLWLNESFAEYLGTRVTADVTQYDDAWVHSSYMRRQWGLLADAGPATHPVAGNGAVDATAALQDFDGISYVKGSTLLKQLNGRLGDDVFFAGVVDHLETPPLRQRDDARPVRELGAGRGGRPVRRHRRLAAHPRRRHRRPRPRGRRPAPHSPGGRARRAHARADPGGHASPAAAARRRAGRPRRARPRRWRSARTRRSSSTWTRTRGCWPVPTRRRSRCCPR